MIIKSSEIFDKEKCFAIALKIASHKGNIIIFGLPNSGKTTLCNAIKSVSKRKIIDEWHSDFQTQIIKSEKNLVIASQYLTSIKENSEKEIIDFLSNQEIDLSNLLVVLIHKDY